MKARIFAPVFAASVFIAGCGGIKQTSTIETAGIRTGNETVATRGDAVIEVVHKESMPNAFGAADVFGRKRTTGTTALIYAGSNAGIAHFIRRDVDINSEKTTMNSTPIVINNNSRTNFSGYAGGERFSGTSITRNSPIFLPPNTPADTVTDIREIPIDVSFQGENNTITVGGATITVLDGTQNELRYTLEK